MQKKIIILGNAPIWNGNRGCVALSYCAMYLIDLLFGKDNYELYLTDSEELPGKHEIDLHGNTISYNSIEPLYPNNRKDLAKRVLDLKNTYHLISIFRKASYILDIGQGDSFSDIYGGCRFSLIDNIHRSARLFKKPYILLPQTIGPFKSKSILDDAMSTIENATFVMTRDKASFNYINEITPRQKNLGEYIDVAFFLPYTKMEFSKEHIHVGLNISALLWHGGYTGGNQFGLKANYPVVIRQIIEYFLSIKEVKLHLISHVVNTNRTVENDYAVSYDLWREYNNENLILAPLALSPVEIKDYIAGMDFFMGARMHATIAAFSAGVPVVPMAYSRKFNGLYVDTLHYDQLVDLTTDEDFSIIEKIKDVFGRRHTLHGIIASTLATTVQVQKEKLLNDLREILFI